MKERGQPKFLAERTVVQDISNGKENIPISAVNGEDFEKGPTGYKSVFFFYHIADGFQILFNFFDS